MERRMLNGRMQPSRPATTAERLDWLEHQLRPTEVKHIRWQTWIAVAAVIVPSVLAFLIYRDQQALNRSQLEVNKAQQEITREQQERTKRRYADRIVWWQENTEGATIVHVENRANVPANDLELRSTGSKFTEPTDYGYPAFMLAGDLRPCTSGSFELGSPLPDARFEWWFTVAIIFRDPVGLWLKDYAGATKRYARDTWARLQDRDPDRAPLSIGLPTRPLATLYVEDPKSHKVYDIAEYPIKTQPLSDCGESS